MQCMEIIDVVLPVDQHHVYLKKSINSIINSEKVHTRILFIDNSEEGIPNAEKLLRKNDLIFREPNHGFARALNAPLAQGHKFSDYVALMNSDDLSHPLRFSKQVSKLNETKSELNICSVQNFRNSRSANSFYGNIIYESYHPIFLLLGAYGIEPTWCSTSEWWEQKTYRNESIHPDLVDLELALKRFPETKISTCSEKLYFYRKHPSQMSRNIASLSDFLSLEQEIENFVSRYGMNYPDIEILYLSRPHNIFQNRATAEEKKKVAIFLNQVSHKAAELIQSPTMESTLKKMIRIRLNSLDRFRGLTMLTALRAVDFWSPRIAF